VFASYAVVVAFTTYFCMYAYRKPFAAARFEGEMLGDLDLKSALIISQLAGYALSKFVGIKFNSEMPPGRRAGALVFLILWAEAALLLFAVMPPEGKVVALFLNGLPLGAVWGLVFSFLEGRASEILGAGLSCAYVVAGGAVKSIGASLSARRRRVVDAGDHRALFLPAVPARGRRPGAGPGASPADVAATERGRCRRPSGAPSRAATCRAWCCSSSSTCSSPRTATSATTTPPRSGPTWDRRRARASSR
jgi:hypothetical protein